MTNADCIRQMTDDELYKFLTAFEIGDIDYSLTFCSLCKDTDLDCDECFKRWLFNDAHDYNGLLKDKGINSGYADCKTEPSSSEIPNNCEHITEDGVTCAKYPACDDCLDNPLNKVKGSERLVKGKTEPQTCSVNGRPYDCGNCEYHKCTADEPQTDYLVKKPQKSRDSHEVDTPQTDVYDYKGNGKWERSE